MLEAERDVIGAIGHTTFEESQQAFKNAIATGRLSADKTSENYAGYFMYMGTKDGRDLFKNIDTRQYLA